MPIHYVPGRLDDLEVFRPEELAELHEIAQRFPLKMLTGLPRWKLASVVEFGYTGARLEGSTCTQIDVIILLTMVGVATGKRALEGRMILNLCLTHAMVLEAADFLTEAPREGLGFIHEVLMHRLLPNDQRGAIRKTRGVRISGSNYRPPDDARFIEKQLGRLFANLRSIADPFDAAVYAACNLAYLQPFEDGNKRSSRAYQNAVLVAAGLPPLRFPETMNNDYLETQVGYYEEGGYSMYRAFFLEAYRQVYEFNASTSI